jgi:rhamnulose-1-phosphate aldolase
MKRNIAFRDLKKEIAEIAGFLWKKSWAEKNAGNISVRVDDFFKVHNGKWKEIKILDLPEPFPLLADASFLITATGSRMRDLAKTPLANMLVIRIHADGKKYSVYFHKKNGNKNLKPSSELPTHLGIHQLITARGSREKVVMHTHATELIALCQHPQIKSETEINRILWGMHPETIIFIPKGIGFVPYLLPGSIQIAEATIEKLKKHDLVLWEKHGVFSISKTLSDAFDQIDIACKSAKIWFMCKSAGFEPEGLTNEQLKQLKELSEKFNQ